MGTVDRQTDSATTDRQTTPPVPPSRVSNQQRFKLKTNNNYPEQAAAFNRETYQVPQRRYHPNPQKSRQIPVCRGSKQGNLSDVEGQRVNK